MDFLRNAQSIWLKIIMRCFGESIEGAEHVYYIDNKINGIRFIDKSSFSKKIFFRFEIWVNKKVDLNPSQYNRLKAGLSEILETTCIDTRIDVKK